jgi:hypothetical protein
MQRNLSGRIGVLATVLAGLAGCTYLAPRPQAAPIPPTTLAPAANPPGTPTIQRNGQPVPRGRVQAPAPQDDVLQDQGTPVTLPDGRSMWIFADTADIFTGPWIFLTSSAGFAEPDAPNNLRFVLNEGMRPTELLPRQPDEMPNQDHSAYYGVWPMGATHLPDGRILISYSKYHVTLTPRVFTFEASGLFEYRYPGYDKLAAPVSATRIADDLWTKLDGPVNSPVYANGHVHFLNCGAECYSLRTTPAGLTDRTTYEWWTGAGWSKDRAARKPMVIGGTKKPGRSPYVQWVPQLGAYAMADTEIGAAGTTGLLWLASNPQGPWSAPIEYPMANCGVLGCYLPNIQPQASTADNLRIAYSSGGTWGPTIWTMDLPVTVKAPKRTHTAAAPMLLGDTRTGAGMHQFGPLKAKDERHVKVEPPPGSANVATATVAIETANAASAGSLRVGPSGSFRPGAKVDYPAGTGRKTVEVPVGPNGRIAVKTEGVAVDVRVELVSWSSAP